MGNTILEIWKELDRMGDKLSEAEKTGKILVHAQCGDQGDPSPTNPYPIFFTAKELLNEIHKGHWHYVTWYLEDKAVIQKKILGRIDELQKLLIKL